MGLVTPVLIANDFLMDIKENPEKFVDQLLNALHCNNANVNIRVIGQTIVLQSDHVDVARVLLVYGNNMIDLNWMPHRKDAFAMEQFGKSLDEAIRVLQLTKEEFDYCTGHGTVEVVLAESL